MSFQARGYPHVVRRKAHEVVRDSKESKGEIKALRKQLQRAEADIRALEQDNRDLTTRVEALEVA